MRALSCMLQTCSPTRQPYSVPQLQSQIGNLAICNYKLIEATTLPISIGDWHYSRIRVIGNAVDSITEPRKKQLKFLFIMTYKKYKFIHNTKYS